jgi:hypothetical protein
VQPAVDPLSAFPTTPATPATSADTAVPSNEPRAQDGAIARPRRTSATVRQAAPAFLESEAQPAEANMRRIQNQIRQSAAAIRNAPDEQAKARETKLLSDLLNEFFEVDARRRETELAQIEERVRKLREQLDRRREKKQEIIDLQLKVALNEADGLGFFNQPAAGVRYQNYTEAVAPAYVVPTQDVPVYQAAPATARPATPPTGGRGGRGGRNRDRQQPPVGNSSPLDDLFGPDNQPQPAQPPIR